MLDEYDDRMAARLRRGETVCLGWPAWPCDLAEVRAAWDALTAEGYLLGATRTRYPAAAKAGYPARYLEVWAWGPEDAATGQTAMEAGE